MSDTNDWCNAFASLGCDSGSDGGEASPAQDWECALAALSPGCDQSPAAQCEDSDVDMGWQAVVDRLDDGPISDREGVSCDHVGEIDVVREADGWAIAPYGGEPLLAGIIATDLGRSVATAAQQSRRTPDDELHKETLKVARHVLSSASTSVGPMEMDAALLGVDRKVVRNLRLATASASVRMERNLWHSLEESLARQASAGVGVELLTYLERCSSDVVDFKLKSKDQRALMRDPMLQRRAQAWCQQSV